MGVTASARKEEAVNLWRAIDRRTMRPTRILRIESMSTEASLVLGCLWSCREVTVEKIANALLWPKKRVKMVLREIKKSKHKSIQDALQGQFPVGWGTPLPVEGRRIYCKRCNQRLSAVPCCKCLIESQKRQRKPKRAPQPKQDKPTLAVPGSLAKVQVLKLRYERGLALFAKGDAKLVPRE